MTEPQHGTRARYVSRCYQCRCERCTAANREYQRALRAGESPDPTAPYVQCSFVGLRGRCPAGSGHGLFGNFCSEHAEYFAQIKADMKRSMGRTNRWRLRDDDEGDDAPLAA